MGSIQHGAAAVLLAAVTATGCAGPPAETPPAARAVVPARAIEAITIHITGLVVVVPSDSATGATRLLLPHVAPSDSHVALLGFGIDRAHPDANSLCERDGFSSDPLAVGMCYVDLDEWQVQPLGAGGQPRTAGAQLPQGLVNLTALSGSEHKAPPGQVPTNRRTEVVLLSGWADGDHCSLARWQVDWFDTAGNVKQSEPRDLINVLRWTIRDPQETVLRFTNGNTSITLPIHTENGRADLILAHIPPGDRAHLPPGSASAPSGTLTAAEHIRAAYSLLTKREGPIHTTLPQGSPRRSIPQSGVPSGKGPCPVSITSPVVGLREERAVATYACIVTAADPS